MKREYRKGVIHNDKKGYTLGHIHHTVEFIA